MNFSIPSSQQQPQCFQCLSFSSSNVRIYMAEFNSYICKQCYQTQAKTLNQYKMNKPKLYPQCSQIEEGLYLGNQDAARDVNTFEKTGVQAVCVCGDYLLMPFSDKIQYKQYLIADSTQQQIMHLFDENFIWINQMKQKGKKIFVHCAAGVSRSASFVIAYLMKSREISYLDAHAFVKSKRPVIHPNSGFVKQLQQYERYLLENRLKQINQ